ncbi:MAG: cation:proton antiporter, partial [Gemmatimonadales bacterium]
MNAQEILAALMVGTGLFFVTVAAIGFVRLPDVFCRLHVTGIMDTLGAPMILLGVATYLGAQLVSVKLLLVIVFLVLSSPLVGHLLAR